MLLRGAHHGLNGGLPTLVSMAPYRRVFTLTLILHTVIHLAGILHWSRGVEQCVLWEALRQRISEAIEGKRRSFAPRSAGTSPPVEVFSSSRRLPQDALLDSSAA